MRLRIIKNPPKVQINTYITQKRKKVRVLTVSHLVTLIGLLLTIIGYFMRPNEIGWFLLGFGAAHVLLGIIYQYRLGNNRPLKNRT